MTQSIITRYHGATNTKPAKMIAKSSSGAWFVSMSYNHDADANSNHIWVAKKLCNKALWGGLWQGGALNDKGDMVFVCTNDPFASVYQFEV